MFSSTCSLVVPCLNDSEKSTLKDCFVIALLDFLSGCPIQFRFCAYAASLHKFLVGHIVF